MTREALTGGGLQLATCARSRLAELRRVLRLADDTMGRDLLLSPDQVRGKVLPTGLWVSH